MSCARLVLLVGCIVLSIDAQANALQPVSPSGETLLSETVGDLDVQVRVRTYEIDIGKPSDKQPDKINAICTYSRFPCSAVDIVAITINGKPLFVPRSAFCSFSDVRSVGLQSAHGDVILSVNGGDASEAYIGKIMFDRSRVIRRTVSSALSEADVLEETIYNKQSEIFE
jgi:hypothetical protein